jgi:hypothetical protein
VPKHDTKDYPLILTEMRNEDCPKNVPLSIQLAASQLQAEHVEEETRGQSKSKFWHSFRAGRITAIGQKRLCQQIKQHRPKVWSKIFVNVETER